MTFDEVKEMEQEHFMPTYGRFPVQLVRGRGATLFDEAGAPYIDFTSGIGVNVLGYGDRAWSDAVAIQATKVQHVSNLYYNPTAVRFGDTLCRRSGFHKVFLCNSGAEANECAVKLARKYGNETHGAGCNEIITLKNSFHGRTVTTLSATGQDAFHQHFTPFTEGFRYAQAGDIDALRAMVTEQTCGVMLELIQGEGGVNVVDPRYVYEVKQLCKEKDIVLIFDEVQTGVGRTGTLYAWEAWGVKPDVLTSAKGLGNGLPIGACLATEKFGAVLSAGTHGSTFGGNPVACAGGEVVLERMNDAFLMEVERKGYYLRDKIMEFSQVEEVRGKGLMLGVKTNVLADAKTLASECLAHGLLILTAKDVLRCLPPLTISYEELDKGIRILHEVLHATK